MVENGGVAVATNRQRTQLVELKYAKLAQNAKSISFLKENWIA